MATLEDAKVDAQRIMATGQIDDPKRFKRLLDFLKFHSRHDAEAADLLEKLEPLTYVTLRAKSPKRIEPSYSRPATGMMGKILRAIIPSLITGLIFFILIGLTRGMDNIGSTSGLWFLVGFFIFEALFVFISGGEQILGRFFKYTAYEFWASPIMMIIYSISSVGQANASAGAAGGVGAGIGGFVLVIITVIIGGFGGLIFFLIGRAINKRSGTKLI